MIKKRIYQNKKTKQRIVTGEKLDSKQWELVREWRTGQMNPKKIKRK